MKKPKAQRDGMTLFVGIFLAIVGAFLLIKGVYEIKSGGAFYGKGRFSGPHYGGQTLVVAAGCIAGASYLCVHFWRSGRNNEKE